MAYVLGEPTVQQYFDANGDPLENGTIEFYITGTSTPTAIYSDSSGTSLGTSVTLNSIGAPKSSGGTAVALYFDTTVTYKIVRKDSAGTTIPPTIDPYSVIDPALISSSFDTLADAKAAASGAVGDFVTTAEYTAGTGVGGGTYKIVAGGTGTADGGAYIDKTDGGGLQLERLFNNGLNASAWGADPSANAATNTTAVQSALNFASNNNYFEVSMLDGKFSINPIYMYYDASNNTGFSQDRDGRIRLKGAGALAISDTKNTTTNEYGTILDFQNATGDCIFMSNQDTTPYPQRKTELKDLTIFNQSSDGFAIYCKSSPMSRIERVSVRVSNATGKGIRFTTSWFGSMKDVYVQVKNGVTATSGSVGLQIGSLFFGGEWICKDSYFEGFYNNVIDDASDQLFAPLTFENTAFQDSKSDSVYLQSALDIIFNECYWEQSAAASVKMTNSGANLTVRDGYTVGGTTSAAYGSSPIFDLQDVQSYHISGVLYFRPWVNFVKVNQTGSDDMYGVVDNCKFAASDNAANLPTGPLYMITATGNAILPRLIEPITTGFSSSKIDLYDSSSFTLDGRINSTTYDTNTGVGPVLRVASTSTVAWHTQTPKYPQFCIIDNTGAGASTVYSLPAVSAVQPGRSAIIVNSASSSQSINLKNSSGTTLVALSAGQGARFIADDAATNDWIIESLGTITGA